MREDKNTASRLSVLEECSIPTVRGGFIPGFPQSHLLLKEGLTKCFRVAVLGRCQFVSRGCWCWKCSVTPWEGCGVHLKIRRKLPEKVTACDFPSRLNSHPGLCPRSGKQDGFFPLGQRLAVGTQCYSSETSLLSSPLLPQTQRVGSSVLFLSESLGLLSNRLGSVLRWPPASLSPAPAS